LSALGIVYKAYFPFTNVFPLIKTSSLNEIDNLDNDFAKLEISWENTIVGLKIEVPTQKLALSSIDKAYFPFTNDLAKSLTYINKALELNNDKPFYYSRLKSLIQAKLGDIKGALETAKISLAAAEAAKNQDYVKMNKDSIAEWNKK